MTSSTQLNPSGHNAELNTTRPRVILWIAIAIALTTIRFQVVRFIPSLAMFDGDEQDAWFAPWVADTVLGLTAPLMAYLALKKTGPAVWGALVAYNAVGAIDYANGLATQWTNPQVGTSAGSIYAPIAFALVVQTTVAISLFRSDVIGHFISPDTRRD